MMNIREHLLQMIRHDAWANRECLSALRVANPAPANAVRFMAHMLSAQKLWLERLRNQPQSTPVWPTSTIDDCAALAEEMQSAWANYFAGLPPDGLEQEIEYRNSKGEPWSSRVQDVIPHALLHSAYHRGQVALEMRAGGLQPAYTDFIHAVRNGFVK